MPTFDTWKCEDKYDKEQVFDDLFEKCINKTSCSVNTNKYVNRNNNPDECFDDTARFYIQVFCFHTPEQMETNFQISLALTTQTIMILIIYLLFIHYMRRRLSEEYVEWDLKGTIVSDYVCKYVIPKSMYEQFINKQDDSEEISTETKLYQFKQHLRSKIIELLQQQDKIRTNDYDD